MITNASIMFAGLTVMTANVRACFFSCGNDNKCKQIAAGRIIMTANVSRMLLFLLQ